MLLDQEDFQRQTIYQFKLELLALISTLRLIYTTEQYILVGLAACQYQMRPASVQGSYLPTMVDLQTRRRKPLLNF
ncbi:hypothetical protein C798_09085 [Herbaspirillum rubrisubalbicans Os34]|uniref:Uncharacterized protein n=1 Tax=Herbaspirillum rubrisubalbicans Os34 TaxID=1235827 RepID=A0A6M3ZQU1_9BURK|nr:hypothetical protein C798_09085 [Herbaspirillum rubrisubalbicans Os34]